jgi:hypothetical protein
VVDRGRPQVRHPGATIAYRFMRLGGGTHAAIVPVTMTAHSNETRDAAALASHLDRLSCVLLPRMGQAPAARPTPARGAFDMLVDTHGLGRLEADVLLLAIGAAVDADFARILAAAGGARRVAPTLSGALTVLLPDPGARLRARPLLAAEGALVRYGLLRRRRSPRRTPSSTRSTASGRSRSPAATSRTPGRCSRGRSTSASA